MQYKTGEDKSNWFSNPLVIFYAYILGLTLFTIVMAGVFLTNDSKKSERGGGDTKNSATINDSRVEASVPSLVNIPPGEAFVGEEYSFSMRITDADTAEEKVTVELLESPVWLKLDQRVLSGTPLEEAAPEKVTVRIGDGTNLIEESFYISVEIR